MGCPFCYLVVLGKQSSLISSPCVLQVALPVTGMATGLPDAFSQKMLLHLENLNLHKFTNRKYNGCASDGYICYISWPGSVMQAVNDIFL